MTKSLCFLHIGFSRLGALLFLVDVLVLRSGYALGVCAPFITYVSPWGSYVFLSLKKTYF